MLLKPLRSRDHLKASASTITTESLCTYKKLCPRFHGVGKGIAHKCGKHAALANLNNHLDLTTREQIASRTIREVGVDEQRQEQ